MFGPWMGVNTQAIYDANSLLVKKIKEDREVEATAVEIKCELCGRLDQKTWKLNGPFPTNMCVDIDNCDQYRWSIAKPLMEM